VAVLVPYMGGEGAGRILGLGGKGGGRLVQLCSVFVSVLRRVHSNIVLGKGRLLL